VETVSGGGTGAALHAVEMPEVTEIRVGTYVFNDMNTITKDWDSLDHCAMSILAAVVSRPSETRAILDSGAKTLAADNINGTHGYIVEYPQARIYQLNEEHAYVDLSASEAHPVIGETVHIIPVHTCVVTNLHNRLYGVRGDDVEVVWEVAARGHVW
jgi:D-serine deaminase-like pyridoxal phosphate-dependent protein